METELQRKMDATGSFLGEIEEQDPSLLPMETLVDGYILGSELESEADDFRKRMGSEIEDRMDGKRAEGSLGTVTRVDATGKNLRDETQVVETFARHGVDPLDIMSVDDDLVEDQVDAIRQVDSDDVFDEYQYSYIRKSGVDQQKLEELVDTCSQIEDTQQQDACIASFVDD